MHPTTNTAITDWLMEIHFLRNELSNITHSLSDINTLIRVITLLFPEQMQQSTCVEKHSVNLLISFFVQVFESFDKRKTILDKVTYYINNTSKDCSNYNSNAIEIVWGWAASVWYGYSFGKNNLVKKEPQDHLQSLMRKSAAILFESSISDSGNSNSDSVETTPHTNRPDIPRRVSGTRNPRRSASSLPTGRGYSRRSISYVLTPNSSTPRVVLPCGPENTKPTSLAEHLKKLMTENCEFHCEIKRLESDLRDSRKKQSDLETALNKKNEIIKFLSTKMVDKSDEEADSSLQIFELQQQLAAQKATCSRLKEKTVWLQTQLFYPSSVKPFDEPCDLPTRQELGRIPHETAIELRRLRDDCDRYIAAVTVAEQQRDSATEKLQRLESHTNELRQKALEVSALKANKKEIENELIAQRTLNAAQFEKIQELHYKLSETDRQMNFSSIENSSMLPPESLGSCIQLPLRKKIEKLLMEKTALEKKLTQHQAVDIAGIIAEKEEYSSQLATMAQKIREYEQLLADEKHESESQRIIAEQFRNEIENQMVTADLDNLEREKEKTASQCRIQELETELSEAKKRHRDVTENQTELIDELSSGIEKIKQLETENRALKVDVERLNFHIKEDKKKALLLQQEIEEKFNPEVKELQLASRAAEKLTERLRVEIELKDILLKEKDTMVHRLSLNLESTQKRLTDSEKRLTNYDKTFSEQAQRVGNAEIELRKKKQQVTEANTEIHRLKAIVQETESELHFLRTSHAKMKQIQAQHESERILRNDDRRRAEADLLFYRTEFERLASATSTSMGIGQITREIPLQETLNDLTRQVTNAKKELENLDLDIGKRIEALPISKGNNNEFQIVDIVDHFEREKARTDSDVRTLSMRLTDAETAYQQLLREHQALGISHSKTLKDLIDLKNGQINYQRLVQPIDHPLEECVSDIPKQQEIQSQTKKHNSINMSTVDSPTDKIKLHTLEESDHNQGKTLLQNIAEQRMSLSSTHIINEEMEREEIKSSVSASALSTFELSNFTEFSHNNTADNVISTPTQSDTRPHSLTEEYINCEKEETQQPTDFPKENEDLLHIHTLEKPIQLQIVKEIDPAFNITPLNKTSLINAAKSERHRESTGEYSTPDDNSSGKKIVDRVGTVAKMKTTKPVTRSQRNKVPKKSAMEDGGFF